MRRGRREREKKKKTQREKGETELEREAALSRQLNEDNGPERRRGESFRGRGRATRIVWLSAAMRPTYRSATPSTATVTHDASATGDSPANMNNSFEMYTFPFRRTPRDQPLESRISKRVRRGGRERALGRKGRRRDLSAVGVSRRLCARVRKPVRRNDLRAIRES